MDSLIRLPSASVTRVCCVISPPLISVVEPSALFSVSFQLFSVLSVWVDSLVAGSVVGAPSVTDTYGSATVPLPSTARAVMLSMLSASIAASNLFIVLAIISISFYDVS